jgi:hypothetical protein
VYTLCYFSLSVSCAASKLRLIVFVYINKTFFSVNATRLWAKWKIMLPNFHRAESFVLFSVSAVQALIYHSRSNSLDTRVSFLFPSLPPQSGRKKKTWLGLKRSRCSSKSFFGMWIWFSHYAICLFSRRARGDENNANAIQACENRKLSSACFPLLIASVKPDSFTKKAYLVTR